MRSIMLLLTLLTVPALALLELGPEEIVQDGFGDLIVQAYSIPCMVDWNEDGLDDLIVGEGGGLFNGKVRVYPNQGIPGSPLFNGYFFAQTEEGDLEHHGSGCMGLYPRMVYWNDDGRKDLLLGRDSGQVMIHLNIGSEEEPLFDAGTYLQWGEPGSLVDIDVGVRSTPNYLDWNNDGRRDLLVGAVSGLIHVYFNEGTDTEPVFLSEYFVQEYDSHLVVPGGRSSPHFHDFDEDGRLDFISGNTNGELFLYLNIGSEESPEFGGYTALESEGLPIDLPSAARSRPFVWDWDEDERLDVLLGAIDGKVHLFRGQEEVGVPAGELLAARLLPPWPNPFNPRLEIAVELQETAEVSLRVLDVRGRLVKSLFDGNMEAGRHSLTWQAEDFGSGLYTILLESAGVRQSRKAVLLK